MLLITLIISKPRLVKMAVLMIKPSLESLHELDSLESLILQKESQIKKIMNNLFNDIELKIVKNNTQIKIKTLQSNNV
jgi:hypothetical protein